MSDKNIIRYDDGKPSVVIIEKNKFEGELKIPTREKSRSMKKKPTLYVLSVIDDQNEEWNYVYSRLNPAEFATIFGTLFPDRDTTEEESKDIFVESLSSLPQEEALEKVKTLKEKVSKVILDRIHFPDDLEYEDVDQMDSDLRDDLFEAILGGIVGSGDSVDTFSEVDETEEEPSRDNGS